MQIKRYRFGSAINFRDLGGFYAADDKVIRWNSLYRSDKFEGTTQKEWDLMKENGIKVIMDLRSAEEIEKSPDGCPPDFEYICYPLIEYNLSFENISSPAMQAFALKVSEGYKNIIMEHGENLAHIINLISDNIEKGGVVFHCTSGKDRTGVVASLLYYILGAAEEDIIADYQTSYTYNKRMSDQFMNDFPQYKPYYNVVTSKASNMIELLNLYEEMDIVNYLIANGASEEKIRKLKEFMLVSH